MGNTADFLPLAVPVSGLTLDNLTKPNVGRDLIEIDPTNPMSVGPVFIIDVWSAKAFG